VLQPLGKQTTARIQSVADAPFDILDKNVRRFVAAKRALRLCLQAFILVALASTVFLRVPQVDGESMLPGIRDGTHVLINTLAYSFGQPVRRGDLVAFRDSHDRRVLLKRVIALGGEKISITDGQVMVNGVAPKPSFASLPDRSELAPLVVPSGSVFVLGDNRAESVDSRSFGPIRQSAIIGKAVLVIWPADQIRIAR
jgi:signal peptidase I